MRIAVETSEHNGLALPRALRLSAARSEVVEVLDQWYGSDYRYCKVKGGNGALYILRLDEGRSEWHLIMFASARAQTFAGSRADSRRAGRASSVQLGGRKWRQEGK